MPDRPVQAGSVRRRPHRPHCFLRDDKAAEVCSQQPDVNFTLGTNRGNRGNTRLKRAYPCEQSVPGIVWTADSDWLESGQAVNRES